MVEEFFFFFLGQSLCWFLPSSVFMFSVSVLVRF